MSRKRRPVKVYRVEMIDFNGNPTGPVTQYMNRPPWWPGPGYQRDYNIGTGVTTFFLEGSITWTAE